MYQLVFVGVGINTIIAGVGVSSPISSGTYYPSVGKSPIPKNLVEDQINITFQGSVTGAGSVTELIQGLNRALDQAGRAYNYSYLEYIPAADTHYRSRIYGGWVEFPKGSPLLSSGKVNLVLHVLRDDYWQSTTLVELSIANGNGSKTGGLVVRNHDDATVGHDNYVGVAAINILGDLPAPTLIEMANDLDAANLIGDVYLGLNDRNVYPHILEGEAGAGGATTVDATSSGGNFQRLTWAPTVETEILNWTVSGAFVLTLCDYRVARPVIRLANTFAYTDLWLRLKWRDGANVIYSCPWVLAPANKSMFDLPSLYIPPSKLGYVANYKNLNLVLYAQKSAGAGYTVDLDYLELLPVDCDRYLRSIQDTAFNCVLTDNNLGIAASVYSLTGVSAYPSHVPLGSPIMLTPGRAQRIYFSWRYGTSAPVDNRLTVRLFYQPRYRQV